MPKAKLRKKNKSLRRRPLTFKERLLNFFQPSQHNRYRSQLLHPETLIMVCVVVLAIFALFNAIRFFPNLADKVLGFATNIDVNQVLISTNEERTKLGLEPLQINEKLNQAALAKAQDMFSDQYWAHSAPDGIQPWNFIKESGYVYKYAGENLARDFDNTKEMMVAWMNSPTHKENIINPNFTQMGLAVVNGTLKGFSTTLVVQMFGSPGAVKMGQVGEGDSFSLPAMADKPSTDLPATDKNSEETALADNVDLGLVEGKQAVSGKILFSPLYLTKTFFLLVIILIVLTLLYDSFVSSNRRYERIVGQNFAHIMFFLTVGFLLILFRGGTVVP